MRLNKELASIIQGGENGAGTKNRTRDLLITSQLLYQLSYAGTIFILHDSLKGFIWQIISSNRPY